MSNVFLSASFITLAEREIGCIDDEACFGKVYGFRPSSLITVIATISGLMSACFLPVVGAIIDFTKYRRIMGRTFATLIITIQAVQIGTIETTWFAMAILQALNGFFYQGLTVVAYAHLTEIKAAVGEDTMINYSSRYQMWMFGSQSVYLILVIGITVLLKVSSDDIITAHIGQSLDVVISGFCYWLAFYFFTPKKPRRKLPKGTSLASAGFKQVFQTAKGIFEHYRSTLTCFYSGVIFGEAGKQRKHI